MYRQFRRLLLTASRKAPSIQVHWYVTSASFISSANRGVKVPMFSS